MRKSLWGFFLVVALSGCGSSNSTGNSIAQGTATFQVTTENAPNSYTLNNLANPSITLQRGQTYTFNLSATGHPFYIMSTQGTNTSNAYTSGVTGNGNQTGTLTFTVPTSAPDTLYYDCSIHSAMTGTITVTN